MLPPTIEHLKVAPFELFVLVRLATPDPNQVNICAARHMLYFNLNINDVVIKRRNPIVVAEPRLLPRLDQANWNHVSALFRCCFSCLDVRRLCFFVAILCGDVQFSESVCDIFRRSARVDHFVNS